jgi:hypothetical protein
MVIIMKTKKILQAIAITMIPLAVSTSAHSAAVTPQSKAFAVNATLPAVCFSKAIANEIATDGSLPPATGAAALSLLDAALSFAVVDFGALGELQIVRHGNNGAVFHLDWGALLGSASLAFTATNTDALALAYANATAGSSSSKITYQYSLPKFGGSATADAKSGAFGGALASASAISGSGNLTGQVSLASVDAANILESWNGVGFVSKSFSFAKSESQSTAELDALAGVLTTAASFNNFVPGGDIDADGSSASAKVAAKAVASAMAKTSVAAMLAGHYKAMKGKASVTDILEAGGNATITTQCDSGIELTVNATAKVTP